MQWPESVSAVPRVVGRDGGKELLRVWDLITELGRVHRHRGALKLQRMIDTVNSFSGTPINLSWLGMML